MQTEPSLVTAHHVICAEYEVYCKNVILPAATGRVHEAVFFCGLVVHASLDFSVRRFRLGPGSPRVHEQHYGVHLQQMASKGDESVKAEHGHDKISGPASSQVERNEFGLTSSGALLIVELVDLGLC